MIFDLTTGKQISYPTLRVINSIREFSNFLQSRVVNIVSRFEAVTS